MDAAIDVVIVSYRCPELLRECLRSLRSAGDNAGALSIHVIDNASRDGTVELVRGEFPEVGLTENEANRGFAAATNQGIRAGRAPYVLVLNPDTRIGPQTLPPLLATLAADPSAGAVGPRLVQPDGTPDHAAKRSFPTVGGALAYFSRVDRVAPRLRQYTAPSVERGDVDAINGAFMLLRREALADVGVFDEGYWMYMEDLDLCYRLHAGGWRVIFEPDAVATHLKGGSAGRRGPRLNFAFHYGMYRFYRKFYAPDRPAAANLVVYAGIAVKCAASVVAAGVAALGRPAQARA